MRTELAGRRPCAGILAAALAVLLASTPAAADPPPPANEPVIPAGREELLADMLGRGATFPDGCAFASGRAAGAAVTATYRCPAGDVEIELRHPSGAPSTAIHTARFAIVVRGGSPPPTLTSTLESRIRAREGAFEWIRPVGGARPSLLSRLLEPSVVALALALLAVAAGGWLLRRPAQRQALREWARRRLALAGRVIHRCVVQRPARMAEAARRALGRRALECQRAVRRLRRDPRAAVMLLLRDERFWAAAILLASAVTRAWLCVVNRESNDDHAIVAHMIRAGGWLPPASSACMECSHAKLYHYALAVAFEYVARTGETSRMLGNLLNFAAGTVLLVLFYVYARRLRCRPPVRVLALAFMSFNAALVGIYSQTTNDGFVILFSSLAIFSLAGFLADLRLKQVIAATVFAILAAASKASGWAIFAAGAAVLGVALVAAGPVLRTRYAGGAAVFVLGFLLVVPLLHPYRQNIAQAHTPFVNDAFDTPTMTLEVPRPPTWMVQNFFTFRLVELLRVPYDDYAGGPYPLHRESLWSQLYGRMFFLRFDHGIWRNPDPRLLDLGRLIFVLGVLPLAALLLGTAEVARSTWRGLRTLGRRGLNAQHAWQHLVYVGVVLASLIAVLIAYHRLEWLFIWMKAIYLFPAILSLFALFVIGLDLLWRRWPRLTAGWMVAMVVVSMVDLGWLIRDLTGRAAQ